MDYAGIQKLSKEIYRPKKIAVCTAWGSPFCWTHAAYNMANLTRPEGVEVIYLPGFGWCPARRHMDGVERAMEWGATHICFLGPDQMHPMDILVKFTKHIENGWPAVAARVPARGWVKGLEDKPFCKIAYKWKKEYEGNVKKPQMDHDCLELIKEEDGPLQEIVVIGSGALMFSVDLLKRMKKPWFIEFIKDDGSFDRHVHMDTKFTWRLVNEAGGRILCDLTIDIIHLDVFPIDESFGERFKDWPKTKAQEALHKHLGHKKS